MFRTRARAATALALIPLTLAAPSQARGLFGKPKTAAAATSGAVAAAPGMSALGGKAATAAPPARHVRATPEQRAAVERTEPLARAAFWAREAEADPTDWEASVRLAAALRALERWEEAATAADRVLVTQPANVEALLEAARARIGGDQGFYALDFLNKAAAAAPRDWRPHSLMGVAMEQTKRPDDARAEYARALQLSPDNPAVLSNLALMAAKAGDKAQAETLLRKAVAQPSATIRERQNLALVLGLSGRVGEAEQLIRRDLPPEMADANVAYLQAALRGR